MIKRIEQEHWKYNIVCGILGIADSFVIFLTLGFYYANLKDDYTFNYLMRRFED